MGKKIQPIQHLSCVIPPLDSDACVFSCQQGRYLVAATDFSPVEFTEIKSLLLGSQFATPCLPFTTGYVGLISYDAFAQSNATKPVFWRIDGAIVHDKLEDSTWLTGTCTVDDLQPMHTYPTGELHLQVDRDDADYLDCVEQIINDIRAGCYYLLNYLRFFTLKAEIDIHALLTNRFINSTDPYKALLRWNDQAIYSFSPEQFVAIKQKQLLCSPIKGTAGREWQDCTTAQALQCSEKDLAELHITIDLARNDIGVIADDIRVINSGQVRSFSTVHHLVAAIQATLTKPITLERFLHAMCPAASISGAPKTEVMRAISEYESQPRGYFMGNIVCIDDSGILDSSVLIRTAWSKGNTFTYAAGGGITLSSSPEDELREVAMKTQILS